MLQETSILRTIRQMIGPTASYEVYDTDLIVHINSAFSRLCQNGVGPSTPFKIYDETATWDDFMTDTIMSDDIKQYIYLSVKLVFDPPESSIVLNAYKEQKDMLEWTLRETTRTGY